MSYTVSLPDGSKVVVLYANNFTWKNKEQADLLDNQPLTGRVYRAYKMPNKDIWYLKLQVNPEGKQPPIMDGVRITNLKYSTPEWECSFVELNDENLLDLDILPEDYEQISQWAETKHEDFIRLINGPEGFDIAVSDDDPMNDVRELGPEEMDEMQREEIGDKLMKLFDRSLTPHTDKLIKNIKYFSVRDPFFVTSLTYLTDKFIELAESEDILPMIPFSREVALSTEYGKGANIFSMMEHLEQYATKSGNKEHLAKLAKSLIFELIRLEIESHTK